MRFLAFCLLLPALAMAQTDLPAGFFPPPADAPKIAEGPCPRCEGAGKVDAKYQGLKTGDERLRFRPDCPQCKGRGKCVRNRPVEERIAEQRAILNAYEREQRAAHSTPVGAGFMETDKAEAMAPTERAALAARFPKRCKVCLGLGIDACGKCDGTGLTERRERIKDKDGEMVYETIKEPCEKCNGTGALPCRRCDGSGLAKICSRCDGLGTMEVKAKRDIPAHTALCRACKGDGRR